MELLQRQQPLSESTFNVLTSGTTALISAGMGVGGGNVTFNVAPGTSSSGADLLVSGAFGGGGNPYVKTGNGTMLLTNTGNTTTSGTLAIVSAGALVAGAPGALSSTLNNNNSWIILGDANTTANSSNVTLGISSNATVGNVVVRTQVAMGNTPTTGTYAIAGMGPGLGSFNNYIFPESNGKISPSARSPAGR